MFGLHGLAHDVEQRTLGALARLAAGIRADGGGNGSGCQSLARMASTTVWRPVKRARSEGDGGDGAGARGDGAVHDRDSDADEVVIVRSDNSDGACGGVWENNGVIVTSVAAWRTTRPYDCPCHTAGINAAVGVGAGVGAGAGSMDASDGSATISTQHGATQQEFGATRAMEPTPRRACTVMTPPRHGVDDELVTLLFA